MKTDLTPEQSERADRILEALEIESREYADAENPNKDAIHRDNRRRIVLGLPSWTDCMLEDGNAKTAKPDAGLPVLRYLDFDSMARTVVIALGREWKGLPRYEMCRRITDFWRMWVRMAVEDEARHGTTLRLDHAGELLPPPPSPTPTPGEWPHEDLVEAFLQAAHEPRDVRRSAVCAALVELRDQLERQSPPLTCLIHGDTMSEPEGQHRMLCPTCNGVIRKLFDPNLTPEEVAMLPPKPKKPTGATSICQPINRCPTHKYPLHWCFDSNGLHTWWCQRCDGCWAEGDPLTVESMMTREQLATRERAREEKVEPMVNGGADCETDRPEDGREKGEEASILSPKPKKPWSAVCNDVLNEVLKERRRQEKKWGEQNHHPFTWLAILGEEVGEANQAVLKAVFGGKPWARYREEMIQVAAVAVSAIECFDRGKAPLDRCDLEMSRTPKAVAAESGCDSSNTIRVSGAVDAAQLPADVEPSSGDLDDLRGVLYALHIADDPNAREMCGVHRNIPMVFGGTIGAGAGRIGVLVCPICTNESHCERSGNASREEAGGSAGEPWPSDEACDALIQNRLYGRIWTSALGGKWFAVDAVKHAGMADSVRSWLASLPPSPEMADLRLYAKNVEAERDDAYRQLPSTAALKEKLASVEAERDALKQELDALKAQLLNGLEEAQNERGAALAKLAALREAAASLLEFFGQPGCFVWSQGDVCERLGKLIEK